MMLLLHACSYVAAIVAFLFVTLSLASGLLYIAEIIEEHSQMAKVVGKRTIYTIIVMHVLFCVIDRLPIHLTILGILCHVAYLQNFSRTWPFISLTSVKFLASCALVIIDHFAWFFYFAERAKDYGTANVGGRYRQPYRPAWDSKPHSRADEPLSFMDVATFFGLCVWLVPFFLFLSLSANDNVLPSQADGLSGTTPQIKTPGGGQMSISTAPRVSMLRAVLDPVLDLVPLRARGFRSSRSQRDGLIASPARSAPPSPNLYGSPPSPWGPPGSNTFGPSAPSAPLSPSALGNPSPTLSPGAAFPNFRDASANRAVGANLRQPPPPRRTNTAPPGQRSASPSLQPRPSKLNLSSGDDIDSLEDGLGAEANGLGSVTSYTSGQPAYATGQPAYGSPRLEGSGPVKRKVV